jgi:hypothetical protein
LELRRWNLDVESTAPVSSPIPPFSFAPLRLGARSVLKSERFIRAKGAKIEEGLAQSRRGAKEEGSILHALPHSTMLIFDFQGKSPASFK